MSKKTPIEDIDTEEGHCRLIYQYWNGFATLAYYGHLQEGRGVVVLDLNGLTELEVNAENLGPLMHYDVLNAFQIGSLGEDSVADKFRQIQKLVETYDPTKEIVVLVYGKDFQETANFIVHRLPHGQLLSPPEAYKQSGEVH